MERPVLPVRQRTVLEARSAGPQGPHARQHPGVQGQRRPVCLGAIVRQRGERRLTAARDGGQVVQDRLGVRAGHRGQGQSAVAVEDGGQPLGQLRPAKLGTEQGRVRVAVDVDEPGGQGPALPVDDMGALSGGPGTGGGDLPAAEGHAAGEGLPAGTVQDIHVLDQIVKHINRRLSVLVCGGRRPVGAASLKSSYWTISLPRRPARWWRSWAGRSWRTPGRRLGPRSGRG